MKSDPSPCLRASSTIARRPYRPRVVSFIVAGAVFPRRSVLGRASAICPSRSPIPYSTNLVDNCSASQVPASTCQVVERGMGLKAQPRAPRVAGRGTCLGRIERTVRSYSNIRQPILRY